MSSITESAPKSTVHYEKDRLPSGERVAICGQQSYTILISSLASQITCRRCIEIDRSAS